MMRSPLLIVAVVLSAELVSVSNSAQSTYHSSLPLNAGMEEFVCGTQPPDWRGRYRAAAAIPDGTGLYFHQDPPILTADYEGRVILRDFTVVGDRRTIRVYYRPTATGSFAFDEFQRVTTRALDGNLVSVFEPSWSMAELLDRTLIIGAGIDVLLDNQGGATLQFTADDAAPPGQLPSSVRPFNLRFGSRSIRPVAVTRVNDSVQFSSHVVNLFIPGFGDGRVAGGDRAFPLEEVTRAFYQTFHDSYDTLVVIPNNHHFSSVGGFHANVQNRIEGIGLTVFDNTRAYGSQGVLQGVEYLAGINNVGVKHEQAHQWGDYFNWSRIGEIAVTDTAHTPIWADRETPLPTRMPWWLRLTADGAGWRSVRAAFPQGYSPMMLYAMGRLDKAQVPDFVLFDNQQQFVSSPGVAAQGTFRTRTVFDAIRVDGERRGPAVGDSLSRANIVVSSRGLITAEEMAYWTYYAQRSEDPNRTGVQGYSGDGSFDRATGVDLRTDIRPRSLPALAGNRDVDNKSFAREDVAGIVLESEIPSRLAAGSELTLRGEITSATFAGTETITATITNYQSAAAVVQRSQQVGMSKRFELTLPFAADQRGVYGMAISLTRAARSTTLAPIVVE